MPMWPTGINQVTPPETGPDQKVFAPKTYESKENIDPNIQPPERRQAAQPFEAIEGVLKTATDIEGKLSEANDVMQETKAKTQAEITFAQQEQAAQNDPNPENVGAHTKALSNYLNTATKGIDNQEVAGRVGQELQYSAYLSGIKIQSIFQQKKQFHNYQMIDQLTTTTAKNVSDGVTDAQKQQDEDNLMSTLQANVSRGLITPEQGLQFKKQYQIGYIRNEILKDPATNLDDSKVYADLNSGKYPLDLKEQEIASNMIKAQIKQNQQIDINKTLGSRVDVVKGIASGKLSWQNSDQISKIALTDPKLGEALQAVLSADAKGVPYQPESDQDQNFADLTNKVFASKTKDELNKYIVDLLHSNANRNMSRDRLAILISAAESHGGVLPTTKESSDEKDSPVQTAVDNGVKSIQDFFKGSMDNAQKAGSVLTSFFRNISGGAQPAQAQSEAFKSHNLKTYPWLSTVPSNGLPGYDKKTGAKIRVYPDGHIEADK